MKYIQKGYGVQFVVVLICILLSAVANVAGSMFLKSLIDDYISPLLLQAAPVFTGLLHALISMAVIYLIGIATTFVYNWLMVSISQGVLKKVRDEMFAHMQKLPIRYFDTHTQRRSDEPFHQRYRYAAADAQPVRAADVFLSDDHYLGVHRHAGDECMADACSYCSA